ncbi:MAG: hypothetical protein IIA01_00195 [Proteobacteria bacterium]|nr:hypothetical protein [Pseudomonadota bacterium]
MNDATDSRPAHQPDEQQDDWAPCIDSRVVYPSIVESAVLYRVGPENKPELVIPVDRPVSLKTFNRLVACKDRLDLIERALDLAD